MGVSFLVVTYLSRAHMGESRQFSVLWLLAFALVTHLPSGNTPPPPPARAHAGWLEPTFPGEALPLWPDPPSDQMVRSLRS